MKNNIIKLHLGCGETYLDGWVNIDAPMAKGMEYSNIKADIYANINDLSYNNETVDEVFLNAVFEHFQRHEALLNLRKFYSWLKDGGKATIVVPDFWKTIKKLKHSKSESEKSFWYRHLFGPQDTKLYGNHLDGFDKGRIGKIFNTVGFEKIKIKSFGAMPFLRVEAIKTKPYLSENDFKKNVVNYLIFHEYNANPTNAFSAWIDDCGIDLNSLDFQLKEYNFGTQKDKTEPVKIFIKKVLGNNFFERLKNIKKKFLN